MKSTLLDSNYLDGISRPFEIKSQLTVMALGLEPDDEVTFWLVQLSAPERDPCTCPPGQVVLPDVVDEVPYTCCGEPITLSRDRPFVVLDAPQDQKMRVKLNAHLGGSAPPPSTQRVTAWETSTRNINDRLRGCPCAEAGDQE